eukprot:TRINITY_DN66826_c11_g1_i1.p2 TRINITY_DN66826_c11_g1~~TRINITY_DN66826_c11_g1_i1.p2  ORF type:complete len:106 (-),score=10.29 TRINITY_DN66826_c11_g1_i1:820-1137(-)
MRRYHWMSGSRRMQKRLRDGHNITKSNVPTGKSYVLKKHSGDNNGDNSTHRYMYVTSDTGLIEIFLVLVDVFDVPRCYGAAWTLKLKRETPKKQDQSTCRQSDGV